MHRARWDRIEAICDGALEMPASQRGAYVAQRCAGDAELQREVESLLEQVIASPSFLEHPIVDFAAIVPNEPPAEAPPESIGPYRIERLLGRGGMGEVYLATRAAEDIRQSVALKVIRRGMGSDEVLQRFRLERRILANLHHPNIARLLDAAATEDGRPYFVMEYIEGVPITEYCDERRLAIPQRLRLFQTVCKAVQHAHQSLVVHRDLKPRNIIVTQDGTPMLLDFGIGKVLSPSESLGPALDTSTDLRLLTPEYAAPEQITGGAVTTSTDVYSLGVLLYELLAGRHPYAAGKMTRQELERAAVEEPPTRPSVMLSQARNGSDSSIALQQVSDLRGTHPASLRRRLAGDIDNIVLMALRKEPERRYPSAAAFGDDIQRHLDGLPVRAQPDTFGYRARKFVRRNAGAVAAGTVAFLALGVTTAVTLVQSRRVARESARVEQERDKAIEVRGFLMEMFGASGAQRAVGDTVTARRLLDLQVAQVRASYADRPELRAEMMEVLADGYDRLGLYAEAEPLAQEALAERRRLLGANHPDVGTALNMVGWILHERGKSKDAEPVLKEAAELRRMAGARYRADYARSLNDLGVVYNALTRYAQAESVLTLALDIRRSSGSDRHRMVGITASNLGAAYYFQGKLDLAITIQTEAVQALERSVGRDHQRSLLALGNLAAFEMAKGNLPNAEAHYLDLVDRQSRLQGSDHPVTANLRFALAAAIMNRAGPNGKDSAFAEAEALYRRSLGDLERRLGGSHPNVASTLDRLTGVLLARNRAPEALTTQQRAVAILRAAYGDSNQTTIAALNRMSGVHRRLGNIAAAQRVQREVVTGYGRVLGDKHAQTAAARARLCEYLLEGGSAIEEARRNCALAEEVQRTGPPASRQTALFTGLLLAQTHITLGITDVADSIIGHLRPALDTLPREAPARRLLDSLTSVRSRKRSY